MRPRVIGYSKSPSPYCAAAVAGTGKTLRHPQPIADTRTPTLMAKILWCLMTWNKTARFWENQLVVYSLYILQMPMSSRLSMEMWENVNLSNAGRAFREERSDRVRKGKDVSTLEERRQTRDLTASQPDSSTGRHPIGATLPGKGLLVPTLRHLSRRLRLSAWRQSPLWSPIASFNSISYRQSAWRRPSLRLRGGESWRLVLRLSPAPSGAMDD